MHHINKTIGAFLIGSALLIAPLATSAHEIGSNAKAEAGFGINADGAVRVAGAEVRSVSGNVINAFTQFGNVVVNWAVSVQNSTKIFANGSQNASTSDIAAGEKISFSGTLTGVGSTLSVAAESVHDLSVKPFKKVGRSAFGEVESINSANGTFVVELRNGQRVTVQTNADTDIMVNGDDGSFGSIATGDSVRVAGQWNSDTSSLTASKIAVHDPDADEEDEEDDDRPRGAFRLLDRIFAGFGGFWR